MIKSYTDHAANERTFLAWLRTGVAVIAFGFLIDRFDLFVRTMAAAVSIRPEDREQLEVMSSNLGQGSPSLSLRRSASCVRVTVWTPRKYTSRASSPNSACR
jgi:uncharacterized membrane protein YidH (DUF202 family)